MGLFVDATTQLQESAKIFQRQQIEIRELDQRVQGLENSITATNVVTSLQEQINGLQAQINNASLSMANGTTLLDLIAKNADEIQSLANGNVSTTLQYNTDVLRAGPGIGLNRNTPNQVRVDVLTQQYTFMIPFDENGNEINFNNPIDLNVASPKVFTSLETFTNMLRVNTINTASGDLLIYIDDSTIQWKKGQTVRLTFNNNLAIGSYNMRIFTDSLNRLNQGVYGVTIGIIPNDEINTKPIIELICTEQGVLNFVYDIVK
jgi:hypothetical protein